MRQDFLLSTPYSKYGRKCVNVNGEDLLGSLWASLPLRGLGLFWAWTLNDQVPLQCVNWE